MSIKEKIYGIFVAGTLFYLVYSLVAVGVLDGGDMSWGMFAFYTQLEMLLMFPCIFLFIRDIRRILKHTTQPGIWEYVQLVIYLCASVYILLALPWTVFGYIIALI